MEIKSKSIFFSGYHLFLWVHFTNAIEFTFGYQIGTYIRMSFLFFGISLGKITKGGDKNEK